MRLFYPFKYVFIFQANNSHLHPDKSEQQHLNIKAKLTKQLEAAKNELNSAVETLGLAEKERVDGIARMEASQRRVEELEALIEADRRRTNDCIKKRIEDFRKYDKMMMSRYNMLNDLVAQ